MEIEKEQCSLDGLILVDMLNLLRRLQFELMFMHLVARKVFQLLLYCATAICLLQLINLLVNLPTLTLPKQPQPSTGMPSYHHHLHKSKVNDTMGRRTTNAVARTSDGWGNIFVNDLSAHFRFGGARLKLGESLLGYSKNLLQSMSDKIWMEAI